MNENTDGATTHRLTIYLPERGTITMDTSEPDKLAKTINDAMYEYYKPKFWKKKDVAIRLDGPKIVIVPIEKITCCTIERILINCHVILTEDKKEFLVLVVDIAILSNALRKNVKRLAAEETDPSIVVVPLHLFVESVKPDIQELSPHQNLIGTRSPRYNRLATPCYHQQIQLTYHTNNFLKSSIAFHA